VKAQHPLGYFVIRRVGLEIVVYVYAAYHQYLAVQFNFPCGFGIEQAFAGRNVTRFQRASKCSSQSTGRCGDHIVQSCGMRIVDGRVVLVVIGHLRMGAEIDGFLVDGQVGAANRPANPLDANFGFVNYFI
jgi:hypothetical protein